MICTDMSFFPAAADPNIFHNYHQENHNHHPPNIPISSCPPPPPDFQGVSPMLMRRSMSFSGINERCDHEVRGDDDMSDDGSQLGEKKRRLNLEQVKALERSFELGNKLEPERKVQLARALGLQPRQVAIWFQNRRARWKTKQLERDYDILKRQFEALKSDNDALKTQNKKLHGEILCNSLPLQSDHEEENSNYNPKSIYNPSSAHTTTINDSKSMAGAAATTTTPKWAQSLKRQSPSLPSAEVAILSLPRY